MSLSQEMIYLRRRVVAPYLQISLDIILTASVHLRPVMALQVGGSRNDEGCYNCGAWVWLSRHPLVTHFLEYTSRFVVPDYL